MARKKKKKHYHPFKLYKTKIPIFKVSNFQTSLKVFGYGKCK